MVATIAVCLPPAILIVWVRMYVSPFVFKTFKWDDALILVSKLAYIAYAVIILETLKLGSFMDIWNLRLGTVIQWGQLANTEEILYSVLMFTAKLSVLMLYLRVFVPPRSKNTWVYYSILFVIGFNALFYIANTFIEIFSCTPREKIWNPTIPGYCINVYGVIIGTAALNMILDFMMILIPMGVIWQLQMGRKRRVEISIVFAFGLL
jgi:hypothetical protein